MKFKKDKRVIVIGDVHGAIEMAVNNMQRYWGVENAVIIFAGDVGLGFGSDVNMKHRLELINKGLKKLNNVIVFMRGNHDNPDIFNKRWKEFSYSNVKTIKDYTTIQVGDKNILCVGGAISVDRKVRELNVSYWKDEKFVFDHKKANKLKDITHVITHNTPSFAHPTFMGQIVYSYSKYDNSLLKDINIERNLHTALYEYLTLHKKFTIKEWHYGHFHHEHVEYIHDTKFVLHGIGSIGEIK